MKPSTIAALLAVAGVWGCGPRDDATPRATGEVATTATPAADAGGFNFQGDFQGPLGVQLYSVRREMQADVPGTLQRIHDMGFREVETAGTYGMTAAQFRQELDRVGLRATSMHTSYNRLRDSLTAVLDEARVLGVQYVGTAWIPHPDGQPFTVEMARQSAADFNRWGQATREQGLQFFYHIHGFEFRPGADGVLPMDVLMRETDPDAVTYQMDVFWAARPGVDPAALLRQYPGRWQLMHVKDMRQGTPTGDHSGQAPHETQVPVGSGQIDYRAVLRAAGETGVSRYYLEDETDDPLGNLAQSVQFLQTVRH
jgi:sugar phosphate isomerase/epimerase